MKYLQHIVNEKMPKGLMKYLEVYLFPRLHFKAEQGILLHTAHRWLHREGFQLIEHRKLLYYDGHNPPERVFALDGCISALSESVHCQ